ncbi:MAG TPA: hypothetical protein DCR93_06140, partial [Cytophagales bacterium]|nr:hypothetical protein [Cytophagales bacterium]
MRKFFFILLGGGFLLCGPAYSQEFQEITLANLSNHQGVTVEWADFNADGQPDFFIAGVNSSTAPTHNAQVFLNNGDSTFSTLTGMTPVSTASISIADYNADGYPDIALMGSDESGDPVTEIYRNNAGASFTAQSFGLEALERGYILWFDVDQDGDLDLLQSGRNASNVSLTKLWIFNGTSYTEQATDLPIITSGDIKVADVNGDSWQDLLITGAESGLGEKSDIYLNNQDYTFTAQNIGFTAVSSSHLAIGDFNQDGHVDVALTGKDASSNEVSVLYKNNGNGTFSDASAGLTQVEQGTVQLIDLDNDGLQDVVLAGADAGSNLRGNIYINDGGPTYSFTELADTLLEMGEGDFAFADFNGDNKLDLLQSGLGDVTRFSKLYASATPTANTAPMAPTGLIANTSEDSVWFSWNPAIDGETASASLTYALYVGTSSGGIDVMSPGANLANGYRRISGPGNVGWDTAFHLRDIPEGLYYWSVQAIDGGGMASAFATEGTFSICYFESLGADQAICEEDTLSLSIGEAGDVVNWYTTQRGLQLGNSLSFDYPVIQDDTVVVEITKPQGCTVYDTLFVDMYDLPAFSVGDSTAVCDGQIISLSVTPSGWVDTDWFTVGEGAVAADTETYNRLVTSDAIVYAQVTDTNSCVTTDSIIITKLDLPVPDVGANDTLCLGDTLTLSVSPSGWQSVSWYSFRQDAEVDTVESPTWVVNETDTLQITVADANGCENTDSKVVAHRELPVFSLGADTEACFADTLTVSISPTGWDSVWWYYESFDSLLTTQVDAFAHPVRTQDTLLVRVQDEFGCQNTDDIIVEVNSLPSFTLGSDTAVCFQDTLILRTDPNNNWAHVDWISEISGDTLQRGGFFYKFPVLATDTVVSIATDDNGCINSDTVLVTSNELPTPDAGTDSTICIGTSVTLGVSPTDYEAITWTSLVQGAAISSDTSFSWQADERDSLQVSVTDAQGCVNLDTVIVDVYALPSFSVSDSSAWCDLTTDTLSVSPTGWAQVDWYDASVDTLLAAGTEEYAFQITQDVEYYAEVTDDNGCIDQETVKVTKLELPDFEVGNDTAICVGEIVDLSIEEGWEEVNWYSTKGFSRELDSRFYADTVNATDSIYAEVFDANGCVNFDTLLVTVNGLPEFEIVGEDAICNGEELSATATPTGWATLIWENGDTTITADELLFTIPEDQTWTATATDDNGCVESDTLEVTALELPTFNLGEDQAICQNSDLELAVTLEDVASIKWYVSDTLFQSERTTLTWPVTDTALWRAEVTDTLGCFFEDSLEVAIIELPTPDLGNDTSYCDGAEVLLRLEQNGNQQEWFAQNGALDLDTITWVLEYAVVATDTLVVRETDGNGCVNYDSIIIVKNDLPRPDLGLDTALCYGDTLLLESAGWARQTWEISEATGSNPFFDFIVTQDETVSLSVVDENGCEGADMLEVASRALPTPDLGEDTTICFGSQLVRDLSADETSITWFTSEGDILLENNALYSAIAERDFTLVAQSTDEFGCVNTDSLAVDVLALPDYSIIGDSIYCVQEAIELAVAGDWAQVNWLRADTILLEDAEVFSEEAERSFVVTTEVTDNSGCVEFETLSVTVNALPIADAGQDKLLCEGLTTVLGPEVPVVENEYVWTPASGLSDDSTANPVANPDFSLTFTLQVTDMNGCQQWDSVYVEVDPETILDAGSDSAICIGEVMILGGLPTASGSQFDYAYQWSPPIALDDPTASNPIASPTDTTTYTVIAQAEDCPADTAQITVAVIPLPIPTVT